MPPFAYTVSCTFTDAAVAQQWLDWLATEHLADVMAGGATEARVVRYEPPAEGEPLRFEVRYRFASQAAFEVYERDHAPRLREEGLRRFPLSLGLSYTRTVGEIVLDGPRSG